MDSRHAALRARHKGKATAAEKGKRKTVEMSPNQTLVARLPPTGVATTASPIAIALAATCHPPKRSRDIASEDASSVDKAFIFRRLEQMIPASDLQVMDSASPSYLLQSAAFHYFQEGWEKAIAILKTTHEDALRAFKELEDFHEEAMAHASMHGPTIDARGAYLESTANVDSVAVMDRAAVPTLTEVGQSDVAATDEEEDPSNTLQLHCQCSRSSERPLPTGTSEADGSGVPQSEFLFLFTLLSSEFSFLEILLSVKTDEPS
nr:hypothetical protein Iba_chr02eCG6790 [Ipomoea batatas]